MNPVRQCVPVLCACLLLIAAPGVPAQDVYRWVDEEGVTHYSSTPPPEGNAETVDASNPPADDPEARQKEIEELNESNRTRVHKKRLEREAKVEEEERRKDRERFCSRLRDKRQILATSPRVRERSEEGPRVMSQEERERKVQELDRELAEHCDDI